AAAQAKRLGRTGQRASVGDVDGVERALADASRARAPGTIAGRDARLAEAGAVLETHEVAGDVPVDPEIRLEGLDEVRPTGAVRAGWADLLAVPHGRQARHIHL